MKLLLAGINFYAKPAFAAVIAGQKQCSILRQLQFRTILSGAAVIVENKPWEISFIRPVAVPVAAVITGNNHNGIIGGS